MAEAFAGQNVVDAVTGGMQRCVFLAALARAPSADEPKLDWSLKERAGHEALCSKDAG